MILKNLQNFTVSITLNNTNEISTTLNFENIKLNDNEELELKIPIQTPLKSLSINVIIYKLLYLYE
jgi:hypothetical protein